MQAVLVEVSCKKYKAVLIKSEWKYPDIGILIHEDAIGFLTHFLRNHMVS